MVVPLLVSRSYKYVSIFRGRNEVCPEPAGGGGVMGTVKDCTTCEHHVGKKTLDDVPNECYPCVHHYSRLGFYPNWKETIIPTYSSEMKQETPLDIQVGGGHYKTMAIQPVEYITKNNLPYCEANVVKYISRWRDKGGKKDLEKAKHYIDLLIQLENL